MNHAQEQREFRADPLKLKRLRVSAGLTVKDFAAKAELDRGTASKMLKGDPVYLHTLADAGERAFDISNPLELLHPDELEQLGVAPAENSCHNVLEWEISEILTPWIKTSNGLQYQLIKLRHRYLDSRYARGKRYELRHLATTDRLQLEQHLRRHVSVCEQVGHHPNIARNLTAAWLDGLWWILDAWHDGTYLSHRLEQGALSEYELKFIMTGIANGKLGFHFLVHVSSLSGNESSPHFRFVILNTCLSPEVVSLDVSDDFIPTAAFCTLWDRPQALQDGTRSVQFPPAVDITSAS